MKTTQPKIQIQEELLLAKQSRKEGNEGRARVCARRAAGAAVQAYFGKQGNSSQPENALRSLLSLSNTQNIPDRIQLAVERLTQRVNDDHQLPPEIDLIKEAKLLIQYLNLDESGS
jgi:hypothetical protein